tara:strand:+ start:1303 stop:1590 length:288 start_codon:yes stop_codon:yes gene_type:complete
MSTIILIGIDPFAQPGIDYINKFNTLDHAYLHVESWLNEELEKQKNFVCGLKGDKNIHIKKYINQLKNDYYIKFYGEFTLESSEPYEYKWLIYEL